MDFVAIDFETANEQRASACSLGIAVVLDGKCVERFSRLIRPPACRFSSYNTAIHGISATDVEEEPEFCDLWSDFESFFEGNLVLAHNASFDMSVLRNTLDYYGLPYPSFRYNCTRIIAKQVWPGHVTYGLAYLAAFLGIPLQHHDAEEDAIPCAELARLACQERCAPTVDELARILEIVPGSIYPGGYETPVTPTPTHKRPTRHKALNPSELVASTDRFDRTHPFYDRLVVFTGALESMSREEAMQCVVNAGGRCGNSLTKSSDYLVVGDFDFRTLKGERKSSKLRRAEALVSDGSPLEIISEYDFLSLLLS